ncbi:DUF349 domain-containing protein [Thalassotalea aquiviva]|uniref:DUF349 domain-containing protein n=1 Tax=Thalassotalea aquiviva TaxID=3242415 RepID=UPI00352A5C98
MIFNNLFKAKWQHKDANTRIEALNEFDLSDAEKVLILRSLITADPSPLVRRAALLKLNDVNEYLTQAEQNTVLEVKQFCIKQLQSAILTHDGVSKEHKLKFLNTNNAKLAFLEQWLFNEHDADILTLLLNKIDKPTSLALFYVKTNNIDLQQQILPSLNDLEQLEKMARKMDAGHGLTLLEQKINTLKADIEKPIKLRKQLQLLLSKLLALKEHNDYKSMVQKREQIDQEWALYQSEFDCLPEQEKHAVIKKHQQICEQLKKYFAIMEEAYQQQHIVEKQKQLKAEQQQNIDHSLSSIANAISESVLNDAEFDQEQIKTQLQGLENEIKSSLLEPHVVESLLKKQTALMAKLANMEQVSESVALAFSLVSKFSGLVAPSNMSELNERQGLYREWQQKWKSIDKLASDLLPASIMAARNEITTTWDQAIKPLEREQHKHFAHVRKKISELKRLIASGKYNSAFGLHTKLTHLIAELAPEQQQKLEKEFTTISQKIDELHELESFVVTPRKKELLAQIQDLVDNPKDNPEEQAKQVKLHRKHWNALGHADAELDKELNAQFNQACELAFAPCREYYAEQTKIRAAHLEVKQQILEDLQKLAQECDDENVNWLKIDARLHKLMNQWRHSGDVDREQYQKIVKQYRKIIDPIKLRIHQFQDNNAELKQQLIEKAKTLIDKDNVFDAVEELKHLQQAWQEIGFAGPQKENQLWQTFRKVNDPVFAKRDNIKAQQDHKKQAQWAQHQQQLADIEQKIKSVSSLTDAKALRTTLDTLTDAIKQQKPINKALIEQSNVLANKLVKLVSSLKTQKTKQLYINLFDLAESYSNEDISFEDLFADKVYLSLNSHWQKHLKTFASCSTDKVKRAALTLELEILANVPSPQEFAKERMQLQVNLLADKLNQGSTSQLSDKLAQWLACGKFDNEQAIIERVKKIFLA